MPRLERLSQLQADASLRDRAVKRKPELGMRPEPLGMQRVSCAPQIAHNDVKVLNDEMRQHQPSVKLGPPAHQRPDVWLLPEPGDEAAQKQLLRQTHSGVRRHLERPKLYESLSSAARFRGEQFVDAELG